MNSKRSHNFIKAILFALTVTMVMTGSAFAWGQVYAAEGTGSGAYSEMQNYDAAPAERVYGIYLVGGGDHLVYVEWLGETELPEDAVLVIEKKDEMTEEEAAEYQAAFDELIVKQGAGDSGADGLVEPGTEEGDDSTVGEDDGAGDTDAAGNSDASEAAGTDGDPDAGDADADGNTDDREDDGAWNTDAAGNSDAGEATGTDGDPDATDADGDPDAGTSEEPAGDVDDTDPDPSEGQGSDEKPASQAATKQSAKQAAQQSAKQAAQQSAKQAAGMMNAANVPKENAQDAQTADGATRDVVPTGIFTGSKLGMILVVLLVAFASAIFFIRSRNQDEY